MAVTREAGGKVTFAVRVVPRASKNEIVGMEADVVKIRLTAPPVEGKANQALVKFLSNVLDIPSSSIEIVAGLGSRNKVVAVRGINAARIERLVTHS